MCRTVMQTYRKQAVWRNQLFPGPTVEICRRKPQCEMNEIMQIKCRRTQILPLKQQLQCRAS